MAIIERQIRRKLDEILGRHLKKGTIPSGAILRSEMTEFLTRIDGGPVYRALVQAWGSEWDIGKFNRELENLGFDLDVLYEEALAQTVAAVRRSGWEESTYKGQKWLLDSALTELNAILLALQNADDHFIGITDTMSDLTKVDLTASTTNIVDLREQVARIPATSLGTERIQMAHMFNRRLEKIRVVEPGRVISSREAAEASFKNAFHDAGFVWRHDVVVSKGPVRLQVTFPLREDGESERLTRISFIPSMEGEATVTVLYSEDGQNYVQLPGGSIRNVRSGAKETCLDFPGIRARSLRFDILRSEPDARDGSGERYSFGLRSIALYRVGRIQDGTYQTKILYPSDPQVERVALETQDEIPSGTSIQYYVSDDTGEFQPIAPLNRSAGLLPTSVLFGASRVIQKSFTASPTLLESVNAIDFYQANPHAPATGEVIFGTAELWRGEACWARETNARQQVETVRDAFIDFRSNDQQTLYVYITEENTGEVRVDDNQDELTILKTRKPINYTPRTSGHLLIPPVGVDPRRDTQPKYAIAQILAYRSDYSVTGEVVALGPNRAFFANRNIDHDGEVAARQGFGTSSSDLITNESQFASPTVYGPGGALLQEDFHYRLGKWAGTDYLDGSIVKLKDDADSGTGEVNVTVDYEILQDVTHLVAAVKNQNEIWFSHPISATTLSVRYRAVPSGVIRPSIQVTEKYGDEDPGKVYREGADYQIDLRNGRILRTAGGSITPSTCWVDFQYVDSVSNIETYSAWCFVDTDSLSPPSFSALGLDQTAGEAFLLDTFGGRIDLSSATSLPPLPRGWHRFSVHSLTYTGLTSGIRKILSLVDLSGDPVFAGTKYFKSITGFRDPLRQVTETNLKHKTRKNDHSVFALRDGVVLLNFEPGNATDLITLQYDVDTTSIITRDEVFRLVFLSPAARTPKGVRLKAVLHRAPDTDPGITPKIFGWSIRISR